MVSLPLCVLEHSAPMVVGRKLEEIRAGIRERRVKVLSGLEVKVST